MKIKSTRSRKEKNHQILVISISIIFICIILSFVPYGAHAGNGEPIVNFYVGEELDVHSGSITALSWSYNGLWIASGSMDNSTKILSTSTWSVVRTFLHPAQVNELSWSMSTQRLAISYGNGTIDIYSSAGWNLIDNLTQHLDDVNALDWNPSGSALSSGDDSGTIEIWDTSSWNSIKTLGMPSGIKDLKWSNDGNKLAACSNEGTVKVWGTTNWVELRSFDVTPGNDATESIAWSYDDTNLASSSEDNMVNIWDTMSWIAIQNKDVESPKEIDWGSDGSYIAVGTIGGIMIWDASSWEEILTKESPGNIQIAAVSMNPDGDRIASGSPSDVNNSVIVWEKNLSPVLDEIGNKDILEDELFTYTVTAVDDDTVYFSDDSELFDINSGSGQISFTPTNDDVGEHEITITVNDGKGGVDSETFTLTVINIDDPPLPFFNWYYGADYVNITLRITGEIGNSVALQIKENGTQIHEIIANREWGSLDEGFINLPMNRTRSYNLTLQFQGINGENPVALSFERGEITTTEHMLFNSEFGSIQTMDIDLKYHFESMGLVILDGSQSIDVDSEIIEYEWELGYGETKYGATIVHNYPQNAVYNVSLLVQSDNGVNRTLNKHIPLRKIPDQDRLNAILGEDATLKFLGSTNQIAVSSGGMSNLMIQDDRGRITGFVDNNYISEIDTVELIISNQLCELYYLPNGSEFTLNFKNNERRNELQINIPYQESKRRFALTKTIGEISLKFGEEEDIFSIFTESTYVVYNLTISSGNREDYEIFSLSCINITNLEVHYYSINDWEMIRKDKAISLGIDEDSDGNIDINIDLENEMTGEEIQVIVKNMGKSSSPFFTTSMILLIIGFISIAGIGGLIGSTEIGKLALLTLILPLYTRIKKEEVLNNEIRGMIRGYIIANPGDNYNSIKRALGLNNGALAYHLKVLEKARIIKSRQNGMYKRFYPASMNVPKENGTQISEIQRLVLIKTLESPGISQKEIARLLGLSKGVINYHIKVLFNKQMLKIEKRGRKTHCYINSDIVDEIKNLNIKK
jgi:WD40 repeat protein/predicted transcriptional regulator